MIKFDIIITYKIIYFTNLFLNLKYYFLYAYILGFYITLNNNTSLN